MRRGIVAAIAACCITGALVPPSASAHPGHRHGFGASHSENETSQTIVIAQAEKRADDAPAAAPKGVSGEGDYKFKLLYAGDHLPAEAIAVLKDAHGGFAVDRRPGKGEIYFALPGAGIIQISPDLGQTRMIPTPTEMRDTNLHNAGIWYDSAGMAFLVFPGNATGKVYTTTLDGTLVSTLEPPTPAMVFDVPAVNEYFKSGEKFVPTDVEELGSMYYITTGYSKLDYVLTAKVDPAAPATVTWNGMAFGGKGDGPGQFGTGHGITVTPDQKTITVADRPNSQIDRFTPAGKYLDTVELPKGSLPCDIDYTEGLQVVGCLEGPDKTKGAPVYILKDDKLVSTVMPKEDLGLANFTHIHNATLTTVGGKLYIIAQAWNPGDFAILEQVK